MRKLLGRLLLAAMAWSGAAAAEVDVPVIENAGYSLCVNEGTDALWVGRLPIVFGRTPAQMEADASLSPYLRGMAADFFADQAAGRAQTYVHFALRRFRGCLARQQVALAEVADEKAFDCLSRLDIPFFFFVLQRSGETLEAAKPRVHSALAGWNYPPGLIEVLAEPSWALAGEPDLRAMQSFILNSCMLPSEMVGTYYKIGEPAPAPAPAPAGKAKSKGGRK